MRQSLGLWCLLLLVVGGLLPACALVQKAPPLALQDISLAAEPGLVFPVQRGVLQVLESPGNPASRRIDLVFHRLPGLPAVQEKRTLVFIEGGPGVSANEQFGQRGWLWSLLRQKGDVVWVDQRGAGASVPQMDCTERWEHSLDAALPRSALIFQAREQFKRCALALQSAGADLGAYHTPAYADDIIAVMQALGVPQFDLLAYSYGTQIGLDLMRRYPQRLGRAALAGVMGPDDSIRLASDHDTVLDAVLARLPPVVVTAPLASAASTADDWRNRMKSTAAALDAQPLRLAVDSSAFPLAVVVVDGFLFRRSLAGLLNGPAATQQIPAFLQQVTQFLAAQQQSPNQTFQAAPPLLQAMVKATVAERTGPLNRRSAAQHFLTVCASGQSPRRQQQTIDAAQASMLGYALHSYLPEACDGWGIATMPESFRASSPLDTPTLLIAATWDMRTPYAQALRQRQRMARSQLVTLERGGHSDLLKGHAAVQQAISQWFGTEKPAIKADFQVEIGL